ncbi:MAG: guanylate kinase [Gammaproteobacteria bacterium]
MSKAGQLFVIAAPSGAGKTSLVKALLVADKNRRFSVSTTTRPKRPLEVDGVDYHFVNKDEFQAMVDAGAFLEHAQVFDNWYGTTRAAVETLRDAGHDVILEIDWQGARQVRARMPDCTGIFILPPSRQELERRLRKRAQDTDDVIARRLRDASADIAHWDEFDYVVVNDRFDLALESLERILAGDGETSRRERPDLPGLVAGLLAG